MSASSASATSAEPARPAASRSAAAQSPPPPPQSPVAFLAGYVRRRLGPFSLLFLLIGGAAACAVGVQYGMKLIVDAMSEGGRSDPTVWYWLGVFIALIAVESALWRLGGWTCCRTVVATGVDIRLDLFRHLTGHPVGFFGEHLAGAIGNRVTATAGATGSVFNTLTWHVIPPCIDFLGALVVFLTIDGRMALALVGFVGMVAWLIAWFGIRGRALHHAYAEQGARAGGELVDVVTNIWTVKAFSAREREFQRLQGRFASEAGAQRKSWLYLEKARLLHDVCLWLMAGTMLVWAIHSWRMGSISAGDVVVISALTFRILHGSRDLALALVDVSQQLGVVGEMLKVVAQPQQVADAPSATTFVPWAGRVSLSDVTFSYDPGRPILQNFDLEIPAGQRIGIVGPSGAGKSTLVALIQRLADVQGGTVSIDGMPIAGVRQDTLRRGIAVVPQEVALFHRSVLENIRYGRADATLAEVREAARAAHCDEFIESLPEGYDTLVGERGMRLSGGQRQRLGIARAFLKDAPLLILDEATSALDSRSEQQIQNALDRLMRGRTVIAIAHRLSTVSNFDRVVVMAEGRIVEDGAPHALRHADGLFADMWRLQSEGFVEQGV